MKKILLLLFTILSFSSYAQISKMGGMASRVNDSSAYVTNAAVIQAHADGYHDIWLSNASNLFWVWNGSAYVNWNPSGGNFWKNSGTTNVTSPVIDGGSSDIIIQTNGDWQIGTVTNSIYSDVGANQMLWYGSTYSLLLSGAPTVDIQSNGNQASLLISGEDASISANDDISISAGATGSAHDINLNAAAGDLHINITGDLTINGDTGTSGQVLQSNGTGAAPTWETVSGGGGSGVNVFAPNIQTGDYTAVIGDTIQVIYMRNVSTPQTLTIPLNVFPVGAFITVVQDTTATTTVAGAAGVDIVGRLTLTEKESSVYHQRATNAWVRLGGGEVEWTAWTPTFTGFSADPTGVGGYIVDGKKVTVYYSTINLGTSNATTFTITNLPFAPKDNTIRITYVVNNNTGAVGRFLILGGATTITFGATPAGSGAFTASSGKAASFDFTYEID